MIDLEPTWKQNQKYIKALKTYQGKKIQHSSVAKIDFSSFFWMLDASP